MMVSSRVFASILLWIIKPKTGLHKKNFFYVFKTTAALGFYGYYLLMIYFIHHICSFIDCIGIQYNILDSSAARWLWISFGSQDSWLVHCSLHDLSYSYLCRCETVYDGGSDVERGKGALKGTHDQILKKVNLSIKSHVKLNHAIS